MTWTTQLTYASAALSAADIAALAQTLGRSDVSYDAGSDRLQIILAVEASTLEEAAGVGLSAAAAATGLDTPIRLLVQSTADFVADTAHPPSLNLDLIGITEIAAEFGVSRQRAGQLANDPDFPAPVVHAAIGRLYTRTSVRAFHERWMATRNPRGGRRRRRTEPARTPSRVDDASRRTAAFDEIRPNSLQDNNITEPEATLRQRKPSEDRATNRGPDAAE